MTTQQIELPPKILEVFAAPRGSHMYRWMFGGRGSGKSYSAALIAALWGYVDPLRVLCVREIQASIKDSFHMELKLAIEAYPFLSDHYTITDKYIRGANGTEFLFKGLFNNISSVKSTAQIDLTIVEEAEDVSEPAWLALEATVFRRKNSELWAIWNPKDDGSPVDKRFIKSAPANGIGRRVDWSDNPFFPEGMEVLRKREQERLDPNTYAWVWEGAYLTNSDSQVFANKFETKQFEVRADMNGPYYGVDFGFAQDPTTGVEVFVDDDNIYIRRETGKVGLELDNTADFLTSSIPDMSRHTVRADSARPESISYLKRKGIPKMVGVKKWPGSVEDGIEFMRSFKSIIIHPDCLETTREFRAYSFKVDKKSGDIMPTIVDDHNHYIDAIRYALTPLIQSKPSAWIM